MITSCAGARERAGPRWAIAAAYAVPLCVLPSAVWRVHLVITTFPVTKGGWYPLLLSVVSMAAALLTLGLVHSWGEVVPRWVPVLGGRPVPVRAAVGAAVIGAALIGAVSAYAVLNMLFHLVERGPVLVGGGPVERLQPPEWLLSVLYAPMLAWGPLLAAVTAAYYRRRTAEAAGERR